MRHICHISYHPRPLDEECCRKFLKLIVGELYARVSHDIVMRVALLQNAIGQRNVVNALIGIIPSSNSIPTSPDVMGGKNEEKLSEKTRESKLLHSLRFLVTLRCSRNY